MLSAELRAFLAVAESGSLSAASQQLYLAVSAVSRQIQRLETQTGAALFERHPRGMVLNDAGKIFESHVRRSMMDMEQAMAEIRGLKAIRRTAIRVACTDGMAIDMLPTLFTRFRAMNPAVSFHLTVESGQRVSELVRQGECDVAFQFSLHPERNVDVVASFPAPVLLVMQQSHPLAAGPVSLNDLQGYPLALPEQGFTVRQLFDLSCHMSGTFVEPVLTCNNFATLLNFLLNTPQAVTICSSFTVLFLAQQQGLVLKSVGVDQLSHRTLQVQTAVNRPRSAALKLFLDYVSLALREQDEAIRKHYFSDTP